MIPLAVTTALALFLLGLFTCLAKTNAIAILMGIEIVLNAAALNFVAFANRGFIAVDGHLMALFIVVLAAAEAVVALAIILAISARFHGVGTDATRELKG